MSKAVKAKRKERTPPKIVSIKNNGRVADNDCRKTLNADNGDQVTWFNDHKTDLNIYFPANPSPPYHGNPLNSSNPIRIAAGKSAGPFSPANGVNKDIAYKYQVIDPKNPNTPLDDPDILVE